MRWPWKHEHKWEAAGVRLMPATRTGFPFGPSEPVEGRCDTEVLLRCKCGALQTTTLNAEWTLEEVRGEKADHSKAVASLIGTKH